MRLLATMFGGVLAVLCARTARADDGSARVAIDADASVSARWPGLLDRLHDALDRRDDVDRSARVTLTLHDASVDVEVVLSDGRSAARSVSNREDVVPTIEALLVVPRRRAEPPAPVKTPEREPAPADLTPAATTVSPRDAAAPASPPNRLRIELSVATGARIGDGQAGVGLGLLSFLEVSGWLAGFQGRADRYQTLGGDRDGALELAVLGGRRFRFQGLVLDLAGGPGVAFQGTTTIERQSGTAGDRIVQSSSSNVPRLVLGARVRSGGPSLLHAFVGVDGELGPARGGGIDIPEVPRLPVWTVGLALGATVGTP